MTLNDLQKYIDPPHHARLHGVHTPPYRRRRNHAESRRPPPNERLSLSDALHDPEINAALDRRDRDYARGADSAHDLASAEESYYGEDFGFGRTDPEAHCDIPPFTSSPSDDSADVLVNAEGEHVPVTVLSDEDAGPEESSSQEVLDFRLQRLRLMRRRHEIETWDREDRWNGLNGLHFNANDRERERDGSYGLSRLDALMARSRVYDSPAPMRDSPIPVPVPVPSSAPPVPRSSAGYSQDDVYNTATAGKAMGDGHHEEKDASVTCARFQIKKGRHKVAIRFEPGVSGRFVLLKLWADRSNVDVQSVIAKGFGGCRFFPAKSFV